jgi:hypothetical protein
MAGIEGIRQAFSGVFPAIDYTCSVSPSSSIAMQKIKKLVWRLVLHENSPILALILVNLILGGMVFRQYGESWDEQSQFLYGRKSLTAYASFKRVSILEDKGPFYAMVASLGEQVLQTLDRQLKSDETWHLMNFLSFLIGLFFLYRLCRRWTTRWAAFGATLLFNTQPLLWGHAFINPKDIPFMAFFLASVELGLGMGAAPDATDKPARSAGLVLWKAALAGSVLGMCTAIRVLGPAAGALVALYWLLKSGRRCLPGLVVYFLAALVTTYAIWPGLWGNPLGNYLKAFETAADYPWGGKVLFNGIEYTPDKLPRSYLPTLLTLQFTEPALALFAAGLVCGVSLAFRKRVDWIFCGLLAVWFGLPVLAVVIARPIAYDNFRQFLFIIPPLFALAALGLQHLSGWLKKPAWNVAVLALLVAPGIYWGVRLQPYQYIYYNNLAGGVTGAFRRYELDYWATSYRELTKYLDQYAPPQTSAVVWGAPHIVKHYARKDIEVLDYQKDSLTKLASAQFAVLSSRHNKDQDLYPEAVVLARVERLGAILAVVKDLRAGNPTQP